MNFHTTFYWEEEGEEEGEKKKTVTTHLLDHNKKTIKYNISI